MALNINRRYFAAKLGLAATLLLAMGWCSCTFADDWPQFLGPQRNGQSAETGLTDTFAASGPKVVWRTALGVSMSGIAVSDGVAFTLFQDDASQFAVALNAETGDEKWRTRLAPAYENAMGNGPRATPTIAAGVAYVYTGEGILAALKCDSGETLWSVNCPKSLGGKPAEYGVACSPLVVGDAVVVQVGSARASVAAFDIGSGKLKWSAGSGTAGYSSPALVPVNGKQQLVAFVGADVLGIAPETGDVLWSYPYQTDYDCNTATAVALGDGQVLVSSGENHGTTILKPASAKGAAPEVVWQSLGRSSLLRAEWQTPVVIDGYLYGLDNVGSAGPITNLVCLNLADRSHAWRQDRFGKSNLTAADGKLFISTMKGELVIVSATADGFHETARASVLGMTRQAPVIANGRLYLRDDAEVVCIDVRAK
jgi:outer membrane protein assembly factor BamB